MGDPQPLVIALDRAGFRVTEPRRTVAELIADREGHFTAADLVDDARRRRLGVGRATIFRALELFSEMGVVERLDLPSGEHAYIPCEPVHHHHVVCSRCGRAVDVEDCGMGAVAREISRRTGFRIDDHRLELYGLCPDCAASSRRPNPRRLS
jgi:Fe2+ or Zn2+ uptake regulation protein